VTLMKHVCVTLTAACARHRKHIFRVFKSSARTFFDWFDFSH
jgi:hypothetical protein